MQTLVDRQKETSASRLRVLQEALGLTNAQLEQGLGVHRSQREGWKKGREVPAVGWLDRLCCLCEEDGWPAVVHVDENALMLGAPLLYTLEQLVYDATNPTVRDEAWIALVAHFAPPGRLKKEYTIYFAASLATRKQDGLLEGKYARALVGLSMCDCGNPSCCLNELTPRERAQAINAQAAAGVTCEVEIKAVEQAIEQAKSILGPGCTQSHAKPGRPRKVPA